MGGEDVSSIFPTETNEYYYQYSPKNSQNKQGTINHNNNDIVNQKSK